MYVRKGVIHIKITPLYDIVQNKLWCRYRRYRTKNDDIDIEPDKLHYIQVDIDD